MTDRRHCLVIGAGTVGACCAWHLVATGHTVTLVDRVPPGQSTSYGNAACLSPSQVVPHSYPGVWKKVPGWLRDPMGPLTIRWRHLPWVAPWLLRFLAAGSASGVRASAQAQARLMHLVADDWDHLLEHNGLTHLLRSRGALMVYDTAHDHEQERWRHALEAELGFGSRQLAPGEVGDLAPALSPPGEGVVLHLPHWQHTVDPARLTASVAEAAFGAGARWLQDTITNVRATPDGVTALLEDGARLQADVLVLAAGAWSNALAGRLDHTVPMTAKRGYHTTLPAPGVELGMPVISGSRSFVMTPLDPGLRLAGTAEFARLDAAPDYRRAKVLVERARSYLPDLRAEGATEWMGQRPMMADSVPVISASPRHANVYYAFGHGHYGLTQGATTGRIVADMVRGIDPGLDMAPYRIDRF